MRSDGIDTLPGDIAFTHDPPSVVSKHAPLGCVANYKGMAKPRQFA